MSNSNPRKRNLPSWMNSGQQDQTYDTQKSNQNADPVKKKPGSDFSDIMEGVVFVLSGFVNPERGVLRSQMIEMGAEYQPDWNSNNCTLLVCAFGNTPKFRQVKAEGGTIISKDWISECYNQKKLVDIETYLLHAGKPWRRGQSISHEATEGGFCMLAVLTCYGRNATSINDYDQFIQGDHDKTKNHDLVSDIKPLPSHRPTKQEERGSTSKKTAASSKKQKGLFSPSKVKKWAVEDLKRTISWLEDQDEKPEPGEIKKIAAEGILTCLQDAIEALKQGQGVQHITDQWACVPQLIDELALLDGNSEKSSYVSKEDLCKEAMTCKQIYELEFLNMEHDPECLNNEKPNSHVSKRAGKGKEDVADDVSYDSDATIEMTEEEIDQAYNTVACSM